MASDLGAKTLILLEKKNTRAMFTYFELYRADQTAPIMNYGHSGSFAGSIDDNGTPLVNAVVRVYHDSTGKQLARVRSDASGNFSIEGFDENINDFFLVAENNGDNMLIYDNVQPVVI